MRRREGDGFLRADDLTVKTLDAFTPEGALAIGADSFHTAFPEAKPAFGAIVVHAAADKGETAKQGKESPERANVAAVKATAPQSKEDNGEKNEGDEDMLGEIGLVEANRL